GRRGSNTRPGREDRRREGATDACPARRARAARAAHLARYDTPRTGTRARVTRTRSARRAPRRPPHRSPPARSGRRATGRGGARGWWGGGGGAGGGGCATGPGGGGGWGRGGRGGEPTRGMDGSPAAAGTSTPSISASRLTNQPASEPRSTSLSSGWATQSFTVASIPAARRDASMKPYEPADPWTLWISRRNASSASRSALRAAMRWASPASTPSWERALSRYSASRPGGSSGGGVASPGIAYQHGEPARQNARAGGSRMVARAGPGAILA